MSDDEARPDQRVPAGDATADTGTDLARQLADIATVLLAPSGVATAAGRIRSLAQGTMDNCDEVGLCDAGRTAAPLGAATDSALMVRLEELQTQAGQGPCSEALLGQDAVYVPDLLDDQRWPRFSPEAVRLGVRTALAYRLTADGQTIGALQLYAHLPGAFNARERAQGLIFATYAGIALAAAIAREAERDRIDNLEYALSSREIIGQAQGILMERERITSDQAFRLLRQSSQHLNRKLRVIAQEVVDTGELSG